MIMKKKRSREEGSTLPRLEDCYLFAIASPTDLAIRLNSSVAELEQLAHDEHAYKIWKNEKGRKIQEPKSSLQRLHGRVHKLLARVEPPNYLHSSVRGRSYITNARAHISREPAAKLDLKKFFPSVSRHAVFQFFYRRMNCARDVAGLLAHLLTCGGCLATGSRASSILAYYCYKEMFDEIDVLARENRLLLTGYVDDITITGVGASRPMPEVRKIISAHGMRSHKVMLFQQAKPRIITGVVVSSKGLKLPHRRQIKIRDQYHAYRGAKSAEEKLSILNQLISRVHEAAQIDPAAWLGKARELQGARRGLRVSILGGLDGSMSQKKSPSDVEGGIDA